VPVLAQEVCTDGAEFDSIEGVVEISRAGTTTWSQVMPGDLLCPGDSLRTGPFSRTSLRLPDGTEQRLGPDSAARWTPTEDRSRSLWDLLRGAIHIISRDPRSLEYTTPFANAGLEGTEFLIEVLNGETQITVIEGIVSMRTDDGSIAVGAGERGVARSGQVATVASAADYLESLGWTRDVSLPWKQAGIGPDQEPSSDQLNDAGFFAERAGQRLKRGGLDAAAEDFARSQTLDPADPLALALAAVAQEDFPDTAIGRLAVQARAPNPDPTLELLTLASSQVREQDWAGARASLEAAVAQDPTNSIAWARLAEARFALEDLPAAESAVNRAVDLDPDNADAHTVRGFVQLNNVDLAAAVDSFARAVTLDQSLALPHVGLGLANTRLGDRAGGIREFELAVVLDPVDALLRSYVAKAYHDERRPGLAESQAGLAKTLDATDPTAYLYETFFDQSTNNPVDGLRNFNQAAALNDDQAAYRSVLGLDDDLAVSTAGVGRLFGELGYEQLAIAAGTESIRGATREHAGHRLLADSYVALPRHQIARVNELLQSQMLQEVTTTAIPPQLAEPNMFILDTAGPAALAHNEFNPLLVSNHVTVQGAASVGGNDTHGEHLTVSGIHDRLSFSTGYYQFESEGFRANNDIDTQVANAFVQYRPSAVLSLTGELRTSEVDKGDLKLLFHEENFNSMVRQANETDTVRFGMHRMLGESGDFLAVAHLRDGTVRNTMGSSATFGATLDDEMLDLQHLYRGNRWQITSGANVFRSVVHELRELNVVVPFPPFVIQQTTAQDIPFELESLYAYSDYRVSNKLMLTLGASVDDLVDLRDSQREFNPKFGLTWEPNALTTVRVGAFSVLQGPVGTRDDVLPRLEPTSVAGFNQFYFGSLGDDVVRYGAGVDRQLSSDLSYGVEISRRNIETAILVLDAAGSIVGFAFDASEESARAYAYWTPASTLALSAELQSDVFDNSGHVLSDGYARLETIRIPVQLRYFRPNGLGAGIRVTYVDQSGDFGESTPVAGGIETTVFPDEDRFWVVDAKVTYRLRGRRGMLNLTLHNLLDEDFNFQDLDPENSRIMPDRLVSIGFTLAL
jgi:tetratricopeptide (TPR) repeat protein